MSATDGQVFTLFGWVPEDRVRTVETVTYEDEHVRTVRIDKYVWGGNDINVQVKTGHELKIEQEAING